MRSAAKTIGRRTAADIDEATDAFDLTADHTLREWTLSEEGFGIDLLPARKGEDSHRRSTPRRLRLEFRNRPPMGTGGAKPPSHPSSPRSAPSFRPGTEQEVGGIGGTSLFWVSIHPRSATISRRGHGMAGSMLSDRPGRGAGVPRRLVGETASDEMNPTERTARVPALKDGVLRLSRHNRSRRTEGFRLVSVTCFFQLEAHYPDSGRVSSGRTTTEPVRWTITWWPSSANLTDTSPSVDLVPPERMSLSRASGSIASYNGSSAIGSCSAAMATVSTTAVLGDTSDQSNSARTDPRVSVGSPPSSGRFGSGISDTTGVGSRCVSSWGEMNVFWVMCFFINPVRQCRVAR